jgi:hypothetical protein
MKSSLMQMGFNARARERLESFQRLSRITNLSERIDPENPNAEKGLSTQLEELVLYGNSVEGVSIHLFFICNIQCSYPLA